MESDTTPGWLLDKGVQNDGVSNGVHRTRLRQQLPEEVAAYVRELIISGVAKQGEYLRMEPIAEAIGVSNTPVREGLLMLRSEGFVRLVPRRGFVVAPFSADDIRDLFWAQASLGGELAARAAQRITDEQIQDLEAMIEEYAGLVERGDVDGLASQGHRFHRAINLAAQSHRLALLQGAVVRHLPNRFYAAIEGQVLDSTHEHPLIVEALRDRDSARARELMEQHIAGAADRLVDMLEQRGLWSNAAVVDE